MFPSFCVSKIFLNNSNASNVAANHPLVNRGAPFRISCKLTEASNDIANAGPWCTLPSQGVTKIRVRNPNGLFKSLGAMIVQDYVMTKILFLFP